MRAQTLLSLSLVLFACACSQPPTPTLSCAGDSDCNTGETCKKGVCVGDREYLCTQSTDCVTALEQDKWNPAALSDDVNAVPACYEAQCVAEFCKLNARPKDTTCDDGDGLPCTQGVCDGAGACNAADALVADRCLVKVGGKDTCVAKDTVNKDNDCEMCVPAQAERAWTPKPAQAPCEDGDGLACTLGGCDGAGVCEKCSGDSCAKNARIASGTCLIGGECLLEGAKEGASHGCQTCQPAVDARGWSAAKDDTPCEKDGEACRPGACAKGACEFKAVSQGFCYIPEAKQGACVKDGGVEQGNDCHVCDAGGDPTGWSSLPAMASCTDLDAVACTLGRCTDKGACVGIPTDSACSDAGPCTGATCDPTKGCLTPNLPTTVTCTGSDGVACTVEHCDGNGACDNKPTPDDDACSDAFECTLDSCDPTKGCVHKATDSKCDDGNVCTDDTCDVAKGCAHAPNNKGCDDDALPCTVKVCSAGKCVASVAAGACSIGGACQKADDKGPGGCTSCQPKVSQGDWTPVAVGTVCADDKLPCTVDQCDGKGACGHSKLVPETCLVKGKCLVKGEKTSGGCQVCDPATTTTAWTSVVQGQPCDVDKFTCTADACDGKGACAHTPVDSKCDDGLGCTRDACKPSSAFAQTSSGCENVDRCPWGHGCDKSAKACVTAKPVVLVSAGGKDPAPTNPAALRHVVDAKTGAMRTWVVYQSQACAVASGGAWKVTQPAALRAVVLDAVEAAKPGAEKPKPATVTFAAGLVGNNVCQGFPAVAADATSSSQGWLTWLEVDVKKGAAGGCLDSGGRGGVPRLAKLDTGAVKAGATWSAVGGACPLDAGQKPAVMTPGFWVQGAAEQDPAKRVVALVRPKADTLTSVGDNQALMSGPVGTATWGKGTTQLGEFSAVHPVVVAAPLKDPSGQRAFVLALGQEQVSGGYKRELWAQGLDSAGTKGKLTSWLESTSGVGATVLGGATAVCGLDAALNVGTGAIGVSVVVRQGGEDRVWLVKRDAKGLVTATKVVSKGAKGDCRKGYSAARIAAFGADWAVAVYDANAVIPTIGSVSVWTVSNAAKSVSTLAAADLGTTDSAAGSGPVSGLAWRGLADLLPGANGTLSVVAEIADGTGKKSIAIHTFKP